MTGSPKSAPRSHTLDLEWDPFRVVGSGGSVGHVRSTVAFLSPIPCIDPAVVRVGFYRDVATRIMARVGPARVIAAR